MCSTCIPLLHHYFICEGSRKQVLSFCPHIISTYDRIEKGHTFESICCAAEDNDLVYVLMFKGSKGDGV